ncbi:hypothetical protein Tco_1493081 [Tanacetum coccineum]
MTCKLTRLQDASEEDHEVHLKLVLEPLKKGKLFAKFSKRIRSRSGPRNKRKLFRRSRRHVEKRPQNAEWPWTKLLDRRNVEVLGKFRSRLRRTMLDDMYGGMLE